MKKIFASPSRYVQGNGVLYDSVKHLSKLGSKGLLICDATVWQLEGKRFNDYLTEEHFEVERVEFNGESSVSEIERITDIGRNKSCDVVIALGGGKTLDTGKAIADELNVAIAVLPTIASTDAPTSALSVIYTPEGQFEKYLFYKKNPDLVLVDTSVVAKAPERLLASGIADALATYVEGRSVYEAEGMTMAGGQPTLAGLAIAEKCEAVLFENAELAMAACSQNVVTDALETIVEANTLLSGIGFESCGLAAAHAIHNGFTALEGDIHHLTHGEKVAYGTLTQLILENRDTTEIDAYIHLYEQLHLPVTLKDLHLEDVSYEALLKVGQLATQEGETIHQMVRQYTPNDVADALLAADAYVRAKRK